MHPRSIIVKNNILGSLFVKGGTVLISILMVPLAIGYLNPVRYGIWITLSSILSWSVFFDIGMGNGLRNKFAEAIAKDDKKLARIYVSTAYFILTLLVVGLFITFCAVNPFLNWARILNAPGLMAKELNTLVFWAAAFFLLKLVLSLINTVLMADQKSAASDGLGFLSNLLAIISVYFLTLKTSGSLLYLGICISIAPVIVSIAGNLIFWRKKYKDYSPSLSHVETKYAKDLANTGLQFFIIQIAGLILFTTDNLIVAQLFGPAAVTPYSIAYRYFSVVLFGFGIIMAPFWTGFTDAYYRKDILWIKAKIKQLMFIWVLLVLVVAIMLPLSGYIYKIWVGPAVIIPFSLSLVMAIGVIIMTWNNVFVYFINGVGKIRLQLYASIISGVMNIPLSIFFAKYLKMGSPGVMFATFICLLPGAVLTPIQYRKIINGTATGIWAR